MDFDAFGDIGDDAVPAVIDNKPVNMLNAEALHVWVAALALHRRGIRTLANRKAVSPDGLLSELLKVLMDARDWNTVGKFHDIIVVVWMGGGVPQQ